MIIYIAHDKLNKIDFVTFTTTNYAKAQKIARERSGKQLYCKIVSSTLEKE